MRIQEYVRRGGWRRVGCADAHQERVLSTVAHLDQGVAARPDHSLVVVRIERAVGGSGGRHYTVVSEVVREVVERRRPLVPEIDSISKGVNAAIFRRKIHRLGLA